MFGIVRDSHCNQLDYNGQNKSSYVDLTKQLITQAKLELLWLKEVASTPLQQSLKDFFDSCKGKRKGVGAFRQFAWHTS